MARLRPCPACARHLRVDEAACRFCGASLVAAPTRATVSASGPSRLSLALLGLCLAACTTAKDGQQPASSGAAEQPQSPPQPSEPASTTPGDPEAVGETRADASPSGETGPDPATTGAEADDELRGTDEGARVDEPIAEPAPVPKPKYGAPRPPAKYGGPPKPRPKPQDPGEPDLL